MTEEERGLDYGWSGGLSDLRGTVVELRGFLGTGDLFDGVDKNGVGGFFFHLRGFNRELSDFI